MKVTSHEIKALAATIEQLTEADISAADHAALQSLLKKVKANNRTKKLAVTDAQVQAIYNQFACCHGMLGTGDDEADKIWRNNIKAANRMFKANNMPIIE